MLWQFHGSKHMILKLDIQQIITIKKWGFTILNYTFFPKLTFNRAAIKQKLMPILHHNSFNQIFGTKQNWLIRLKNFRSIILS